MWPKKLASVSAPPTVLALGQIKWTVLGGLCVRGSSLRLDTQILCHFSGVSVRGFYCKSAMQRFHNALVKTRHCVSM